MIKMTCSFCRKEIDYGKHPVQHECEISINTKPKQLNYGEILKIEWTKKASEK